MFLERFVFVSVKFNKRAVIRITIKLENLVLYKVCKKIIIASYVSDLTGAAQKCKGYSNSFFATDSISPL
jgi:hypothetical protein